MNNRNFLKLRFIYCTALVKNGNFMNPILSQLNMNAVFQTGGRLQIKFCTNFIFTNMRITITRMQGDYFYNFFFKLKKFFLLNYIFKKSLKIINFESKVI